MLDQEKYLYTSKSKPTELRTNIDKAWSELSYKTVICSSINSYRKENNTFHCLVPWKENQCQWIATETFSFPSSLYFSFSHGWAAFFDIAHPSAGAIPSPWGFKYLSIDTLFQKKAARHKYIGMEESRYFLSKVLIYFFVGNLKSLTIILISVHPCDFSK